MSLKIEPFGNEHLDVAAALLAARHRADRAREPDLPVRFEDPAEVRPLLKEATSGAKVVGTVALRDGEVVGYLVGRVNIEPGLPNGRAAWVDYAGHAALGPDRVDTYRALYAAVAPRWLAAGCFSHAIHLPGADREALQAWFALGFGRQHTRGLRDTAPVAGVRAPAGVEVHEAGEEDIEPLTRMERGLALHHAASPVFALVFSDDPEQWRRQAAQVLSDPAYRCLLALRDGDTLGMFVLSPVRPYALMVTPDGAAHITSAYTETLSRGSGVGALLLETALARARDDGAVHCTVSWWPANLSAARFWEGNGFRPILQRLVRDVDPRIAWARPASEGSDR